MTSSAPARMLFQQAAPPGFGDPQNSWAWAMLWWQDALYVGTHRAWYCAQRTAFTSAVPEFLKKTIGRYIIPPPDPAADCPDSVLDLPMQAEIWRWTPTDGWERVYQSPQDVPIPGHPGRFVAREVGYRYMTAFTESDGSEAMYVSGVNARYLYRDLPAPCLLRTVDGRHFEPIPHDRGTFLGDLDTYTFRSIFDYKGRLFVLTGHMHGSGVLLESANPAAGNNAFRQVSPPGMKIFEMVPFNGYLYLGVHAQDGYAIVRTDASGDPYTFVPVVTQGGYLPAKPSLRPISMHVFQGCLYAGMDRPQTEIIRIHPDDTWDLVIGMPRETPTGWKTPISGIDAGFNTWLNGHIWRMQEHEGRLYVGTMNMSVALRKSPRIHPTNFGFDLYETGDGWHFAPITANGFGNDLDYGVRSLASTPHGLFVGSANNWRAFHVWHGSPILGPAAALPAVNPDQPPTHQLAAFTAPPPERLALEQLDDRVLLSWDPSADGPGTRYHVWRALVRDERTFFQGRPWFRQATRILRVIRRLLPTLRRLRPLAREVYLPPLPEKVWMFQPYERVGVTTETTFLDAPGAEDRHVYYVQAESAEGAYSPASNVVAVPLLTPATTFESLLDWARRAEMPASTLTQLSTAEEQCRRADWLATLETLAALRQTDVDFSVPQYLLDWHVQLDQLSRRVQLCRHGLLSPNHLLSTG
ncbi:MAG: hypothetical protein H6650_05520 [Ardenticatenales bacterium]|nr:hypothetical protein [Ardenticatenales bacterium]